MAKHHLLVLGLLIGLCAPLQAATTLNARVYPGRHKKNPPPSSSRSFKRSPRYSSKDSVAMDSLLADGFTAFEVMQMERQRMRDARIEAELAESLNYPAIDLYGENSWGEYVNPYAGTSARASIPETYDIDCSSFTMPLDGNIRVTSNYGYRRRYRRMHRGVDINLNTGDTVRAAFDGKVRINNYEGGGYGHYLVIRHNNGLETVYAHLSRKLVTRGDVVRAGDPIGLGGSTGRSTGPHLHFETRFMGIDINPAMLFDLNEGVPLRDVYTFRRGGRGVRSESPVYAQKSSASIPSSGKAGANRAPKTYRIRQGDTLSTIASRNGTTVKKLCTLNNMSTKATLRVGKTLRIR